MRILAKGNRLSITPLSPEEWRYLKGLGKRGAPLNAIQTDKA
jgi:predicted RNA-binding protein with PUA-like domain